MLTAILCGFIALYFLRRKKRRGNAPQVSGALPFMGHAVAFGADPFGFLMKARKRYGVGRPFGADLVGLNTVFVDGEFAKLFFQSKEKEFSFTEATRLTLAPKLTFGEDVVDNPFHAGIIRRKSAFSKMGPFVPEFCEQVSFALQSAGLDISTMVPGDTCSVESLQQVAWLCVAHCSSRAFVGLPLCNEPELIDIFINYHRACFKVFLSPFLPYMFLSLSSLIRVVSSHFTSYPCIRCVVLFGAVRCGDVI